MRTVDRVTRAAFWRRVQRRLDALELSRNAFGRAVGVSAGPVSEYFSQLRMPRGEVMIRMPAVLRCNGHWLLTGRGPEELPAGKTADYRAGERAALVKAVAAVRGALQNGH